MFYDKLTADQVTTTYGLIKFLQRLRVIGDLQVRTVKAIDQEPLVTDHELFIDMTGADYALEKLGYDPSKGKILQHEMLEKVFGRLGKRLRGTD